MSTGRYIERGGLLVPADMALPDQAEVVEAEVDESAGGKLAVAESAGVVVRRQPAEELAERLAARREAIVVRRADVLARREQDVDHQIALADVDEREAEARRSRRDRVQDRRESADLERYYRRAVRAGTRARIRADIQRSAEMRALRVAMVRRYAMLVGLPIVAGFAAWSTPGVQHGMVRLLGLEPYSAGWVTAWAVEPLLIAVAVGIIVVKSILRSSGGQTDWRVDAVKWGALACSVALNMLGGWRGGRGLVTAVGEALGHSIGAIGAAVVAWAIGVVVDYTNQARPWDGAQRLADMGLDLDLAAGIDATRTADATRTNEPNTRTDETERRSSEPVRAGEVVRVASEVVRDGGESDGTESQNAAARMAWIAAYRAGVTVSGAELGRAFGLGERWGQKRAKEAREELARLGEPTIVAGRINGRRVNGVAVTR